MKSLRIISYIFIGLGVLLFLTAILFKIQHWPNIFNGLISGPIVTVIGVLTFIISLKKRQEKNINVL